MKKLDNIARDFEFGIDWDDKHDVRRAFCDLVEHVKALRLAFVKLRATCRLDLAIEELELDEGEAAS